MRRERSGHYSRTNKFPLVNGDRYEGNWKEDKKEGAGIFYYKNGAQFKGMKIYLLFLSLLSPPPPHSNSFILGTWKADRREGKGMSYQGRTSRWRGNKSWSKAQKKEEVVERQRREKRLVTNFM